MGSRMWVVALATVFAVSGCAAVAGGSGDAQRAHDREIEEGRKRREQMDREEAERRAAEQEAAKKRQADEEAERARMRKEHQERQAREKEQLAAAEKAREKDRADHAARRDAAVKVGPTAADLVALVNDPAQFAGKAIRVSARWLSVEPDVNADGFNVNELPFDPLIPGGDPSGNIALVELAPPLKMAPKTRVAIDYLGVYVPRAEFFRGLRGAAVELVLYVREKPAPAGFVAEVVEAKAK